MDKSGKSDVGPQCSIVSPYKRLWHGLIPSFQRKLSFFPFNEAQKLDKVIGWIKRKRWLD